jgi:iron complex outermembrane receptor protein
MYQNLNPMTAAIRRAIVLGALAAVAAPVAYAQSEDDSAERLDEVVVTGSRIKRTDAETASPIVTIDRAAIQSSGLQSVGDIVRNLTQADSLGLTNVTGDTNANDGTQSVSLRGLGSARTLVLVNGRRWADLGNGVVDTSTIPAAVIERVEVLTDGASAIYGSDAIGGVINLILRADYEGAEVDAYYGQYDEGDGDQMTVSATFGFNSERGNAIFSVNKTEFDPVFAGDRAISSVPQFGVPQVLGSAFGRFGNFSVPRSAVPHLNLPAGGNVSVGLNPAREGAGNRTASDFQLFSNALRYNFAPTNYLFTPSDRLSAYTQMNYALTDSVNVFAQFNFNQRKSVTQIAEVPLTINASGPQWAFPVSARNVFNPFGVDLNGNVGYRMVAAGPRINSQDYDTYFGTVGLNGSFLFADRYFSWETYFSRGENSRGQTGENYVNLANLRQGLGPSFRDAAGVARCGAAGAVIAGCVPINLFNGAAGMTPEMINYITYTLNSTSRSALQNFGASITGSIMELPAGDFAFAAGLESRNTTLQVTQDGLVAGGFSSNNFTENTSGSVGVDEFYAELVIPLLADAPLAERLELTLAARSSDYEHEGRVGSSTIARDFDADTFKYGFTWKPISDLLVRGNYADTFRAPAVSNLYGGGQESFPAAIDPCTNASFASNPFATLTAEQQARCRTAGVPAGGATQLTSQLRALGGGNPLLNPEEGRTLTFGVVYSPEWFSGFDVSVDWYNIQLENGLASRSANSVLSGCIRDGVTEDCSFIVRDAAGAVQTVRLGQFNLAEIEVEGIDINMNYRWDTNDWGNFRFSLNNSYIIDSNSDGETRQVGVAEGIFGDATWRLRSNFNADWTYGPWGLNYGARYFSSLIEDCPTGLDGLFSAGLSDFQVCNQPVRRLANGSNRARNRIGATTYHDLQGTYATPWGGTLRVGARNLFDKQPPLSVSTFANSFLDSYDIPGTFWYVGYTQQF